MRTKYLNIKSLKSIITCSFLLICPFIESCTDFLDIDPPRTEIVREVVFSDNATAIAAVRGIYSSMISQHFASGDLNSVSYLSALSADELMNFSSQPANIEFATNSLLESNGLVTTALWGPCYQYINNANAVIEGLKNSVGVTQGVRDQLRGQALFIRAFCHFYLVNLFGAIPIVTSTDFEVNRSKSRASETDVYDQIIIDLLEAQALLSEDYSFSNNERIEPNRWAATALLARVYLYKGDWNNASAQATSIIENTGTFSLVSNLNEVFLANSREAIWQLKPVRPGLNTFEANIFTITSFSPINASLSTELIAAVETGDNRFNSWISSITNGVDTWYYSSKYKVYESGNPLTEYSMVLRVAEQYFIRAEARTHVGNIGGAQSDLNTIRNRAGLGNTIANDQITLLMALEQERRVELFTEWGHRWLDLKRTDRADAVLSSVKPSWQSTDALYPIPKSERQTAPNLSQNLGY